MSTFEELLNSKKKNKDEKEKKQELRPITETERTSNSFDDWINRQKNEKVDSEYINNFLSDASNFYYSAQRDFGKSGYSDNYKNMYKAYYDTGSDLANRSSKISKYLEQNKNSIDRDSYNSLSEYLTKFDTDVNDIVNGIGKNRDFYSQWNSEDEYKKAVDDYNNALAEYNTYRINNPKIFAALDAPDYEEYSQKGASIKNPSMKEAEGWFSFNGNPVFGKDIGNIVTFSRDNSDYIKAGNFTATKTVGKEKYSYMTDDEVGAYNYYLAKEKEGLIPKGTSDDYLNAIDNVLIDRQMNQRKDMAYNIGQENPFLASAISVFAKPANIATYAGQIKDIVADGKFEEDASYTNYVMLNNAYRGGVSDLVERKFGKFGSFLYGTGMSMADFLFTSALTGGSEALALSIMGTEVAPDVTIALKEKGLGDTQAFTLGSIAGAIEILTEKIGFDALFKADWSKGAGRYILMNMLSEGAEEGASDLLNGAASLVDYFFISKDKSELEIDIQNLMKEKGLSRSDAQKQILKDFAKDFIVDTAGGALSGGILAGAGAGLNTLSANNTYGNLYYDNDMKSAAINKALENDPSNAYAQKLSDRLANGKNVRGSQMQRLELLNQNAINSKNFDTVKNSVSDMLNELGETGDVYGIAEAIAKERTGEKLSRSERNLIKNSDFGNQLLNEIIGNNNADENGYSAFGNKVNSDIEKNYSNMSLRNQAFVSKVVNDLNKENAISTSENSLKVSEGENEGTFRISDGDSLNVMNVADKTSTKTKVDGREVQTNTLAFNTDRGIVEDSDISFGNKDLAVMYGIFKDSDMNASEINQAIAHFENSGLSAAEYANAITIGWRYGYANIAEKYITADTQYKNLSEAERAFARNLGEQARIAYDAQYKEVRVANENAKVVNDTGREIEYKSLNDVQRAGLQLADAMSRITKNNIHIYESVLNDSGNRVFANDVFNYKKGSSAPNGIYDTKTGDIYIDINAGNSGSGTMNFTIAHEYTHDIRKVSTKQFKELADFLFSEYGEKGVNVESLIQRKINTKSKNGGVLSFDEAYEEVVADAMEQMLARDDFADRFSKLKEQSPNLWEMFKDLVSKLINALKDSVKAYKNYSPNSLEANLVNRFSKESIQRLEDLYYGALLNNSNMESETESIVSTGTLNGSADGAVVASEVSDFIVKESASAKLMERGEFDAMPKMIMSVTGGDAHLLTNLDGVKPNMVKGIGGKSGTPVFTIRQVRDWAMGRNGFTKSAIDRVNSFMDAMDSFMKDAGVTYRFIGLNDVYNAKLSYTYNTDGSIKSVVLSAMVKNGDYPVNFDLTAICKKKEATYRVIDKLCKNGAIDSGAFKLTPENIFAINRTLKNDGYETACLGCFVESKRYNIMDWATKFCKKWNASVKKINKNATYFNFGSDTFKESDVSIDYIMDLEKSINKYNHKVHVEMLANAMKNYKDRAAEGKQLLSGKEVRTVEINGESVKTFSKAATERLENCETLSDELKEKYLTCDVTKLNIDDVQILVENGILNGQALSNKAKITELVNSGEAYQHLLRPSDIMTADGLAQLEKLPNFHGILYGHYGSGTPKLVQGFTPYNSEIALLAEKKGKQTLADYLYSIAGVRMQSFSDFQIQNVYDYLQMVGDLSARKLPAHAYTKEISFAKLFGMTGIKINLSVMFDIDPSVDKEHAGLTKLDPKVHTGEYGVVVFDDADGKWVYNIGDYAMQKAYKNAYPENEIRFLQSIGFADAVKLQTSKGYSSNLGIIGVGYSYNHILAMLNDSRIRYIIPYHSSSLPSIIKDYTHISLATDWQPYQNNMKIKSIVDKNKNSVKWSFNEATKRLGSSIKAIEELNNHILNDGWVVSTKKSQNGHGSFGLYEDLQATSDPKATALNYIDWCAKNNTIPLFYQFAGHENYYKVLYDYNVYDCITEEYAPQGEVTNSYPERNNAGDIVQSDITEGSFNDEYLKETIDKQMSFMNNYFENFEGEIDKVVSDVTSKNSDRDISDFAKGAEDYYGTTNNWELGGYLTVNGKMLDFSAGQRQRVVDHREISDYYDDRGIELSNDVNEGMIRFMNDGNIRFQSHSGFELAKLPTKKQFDKLADIIDDYFYGYVSIDYSDETGRYLGTSDYEEDTSSTRIISDIKKHFEDGSIPEGTAKFSDRDSEGNKLTKAQQEYFKDSKVRDSEGTLLVMYHGTGADFTEFDRNFIGKTGAFEGAGFNFTPSEGRASSYGGRVMSGYINVTRPLSSDSVTMNARELAKLIEKLDPTGDDIIANYARDTRDYGTPSFVKREALTTARAVLQYADNDVDVYSDLSAGSGGNVSLIEGFEELGYDGVIHYNDDGSIKTVITFNSNQFKNTDNTNPTTDADIRYSDRDYAPVWYSKMTNVINDIKPAKMGATGVVPYLKGKGIKDEEIKWSGIATFLEGKKSVTKEELQEFAKNSSLNISEETLSNYEAEFDEFDRLLNKYTDLTAYDYDPDFYSSAEDFARSQIDDYLEDGSITQEQYDEIIESAKKIGTEGTRWNDYVVSVGKNYREILFRLPNSNYINDAMQTHWGREGVLAHARLQDFDTKDFGKMLFIEEIQSDWHNAGKSNGYTEFNSNDLNSEYERKNRSYEDRINQLAETITGGLMNNQIVSKMYVRGCIEQSENEWAKASTHLLGNIDEIRDGWGFEPKEFVREINLLREMKSQLDRLESEKNKAPDAPFKNYTDFVLKRLLRMAAEGGYDSIGWTTGKMQEKRWSSDYAEGYRIEYDQDIPKFLNKYGKQWGAKVEMTSASDEDSIVSRNSDIIVYKDGDRIEHRNGLWVYKDSSGYERGAVHDDVSIDEAAKELRKTFGKKSTPSHYAMMLTDSMKESVLYKGQPMFSERDTESFDNRTLLANAMESVAKNDIEKKYIENYKSKIDAINEEERKLSDLRAEIKELSFSKGKRDTERIKSLRDEATKSANRINTYDKQLLKLEASSPLKSVLEREKASAIKKAEAKAKQALSDYRESAMKRQEEIISRYQESRRRGIDQRQSTKLRNAVKKYIEDFRKRIQHPTDRRYIPSNLVSGIIDVYDMIDPTGENQESLAAQKYRTVKEALADLKLQYDSLAQNVDYDFSSEFDSEFSKRIAELANSVGNVPLRDMSRSQLEDVYEIIHDISVMIHQATKMIGTDEAITNYEAGQEVIENMQTVKRLGLTQNKVETFFREWTLNPMRAVREMSGFDDNSMLVKLFNGLNEGRRKADKFKMDVTKKFDAMRSSEEGRKAFNDAVEKATITVYDIEGKEVKISKMQAMQAILTYEREQANDNRNHLSSPVRFTNVADDVKGKYSNAFDNGHNVYVDENFVQRCRKEFSEWDNRYIDLARRFFNEDSKNAINEVSLLTKHRLTATEKAYIPYKVNSDYISKESDNVKYDASIGGAGILKSVKNNAPQQLVIRGLNALIDEHIDDVAKIYGLTVPVRNFNKVFNMKQTKDDGGIPVKSAIRDTWQDGGLKLIDQAVADLQSNRRTESSKALSAVKSGFVVSTLASNISVWMKQAASYPTAGAILSASSLEKALPNFARNLDNVYEEIDKYTSQHWIRRQGLSSQELGEMNQSHGWQNRLNDKLGVLSPMNWIQAMDVKTTAVLWIACKNEVQSMGIKPSDAEYFDKVTELYDKVIEDTQPMYDSLHRAEITKNSAWKNIIMFQTQPIQNSGILREGAMEYKMAKKQYGKNSKQAKEAFKKFRMAVGSQMASHLTFTAMTLLAAAILHKMNPYRDDDKELTIESVLTEFGKQFEKNFIGAVIPVIGTYATSIIEKFEGGNRYDVVSDPTVDKINSTIDTFSKLSKPSLSNFKDVLVDVSTYFGIPAKNAENIINGVKMHIQDISGSGFLSFEAGVERTGKQDYGRVYESIMDNDTEEIARLKKKYGDKYSSEVRKALADNDSRITDAAKARIDGDVSTYTSIARSIIADGFTQDDVVSAINTVINSLKKGETSTPTSAPKSKSLYDINDFATAIETNNRSMMEEIRNDMIEISVANGKTRESAEESFATSAYNAIKDGYELGQISDTQAVDALVKYGGKSEDYANSKVRFWRFQEEYPEYNITEEQLNKYYNPVEGLGYSINESGISVETYADYVVRRKDCTGTDEDGDGKTDSGSVKAEVLKLIDRLPISNYQKDALYYLNGWSSKTIDDAGWH